MNDFYDGGDAPVPGWDDEEEQPVCPCCALSPFFAGPCYGTMALYEAEPDKQCATEGCTCWGGPTLECEDCWLASK